MANNLAARLHTPPPSSPAAPGINTPSGKIKKASLLRRLINKLKAFKKRNTPKPLPVIRHNTGGDNTGNAGNTIGFNNPNNTTALPTAAADAGHNNVNGVTTGVTAVPTTPTAAVEGGKPRFS